MDISRSIFHFLLVLLKPMPGYQIKQAVESASGGELTMGAGSCYGLIARCLQEKLIELVEEVDRKKMYRVTRKGRDMLQDESDRMQKQLNKTKDYLGEIYDQSIKV